MTQWAKVNFNVWKNVREAFLTFFVFFCGIKSICKLRQTFFLNLQPPSLFHKNLRFGAAKICSFCGLRKPYLLPPPKLMFFKLDVLNIFANFTGKHLYWSLFLIRPATLWKRDFNAGVFLWNFAEYLRTPFFKEHLRWLLLNFINPFYATGFFLCPIKTSGGLEKYQWHEMGYKKIQPQMWILPSFQELIPLKTQSSKGVLWKRCS